MTEKGKILKSASVVALATVISRICGYLRDQRVALLLGTSPTADSFILAFRIPNMIRRLTGEGALGASFIPVFIGYLRGKPRKEAWAVRAAGVLGYCGRSGDWSPYLGCVFSRQVIGFFTILGVKHLRWDLAVYLNRIIFPVRVFPGTGGAGVGDSEQFSPVRSAGVDVDIFQSGVHCVFFRGGVPADYEMGAGRLSQTPAVALAAGILLGSVLHAGHAASRRWPNWACGFGRT